ncbi:MAG: VOC family protein [Bacteroidota bacterium]|nr:VOC family protein [Bacteroidota bacterium]
MKIKLNHIALNIITVDEITDFYQNILGFHLEYQFELPTKLSNSIFEINKSVPAYFCKNEQVAFELFVLPTKINKDVAHICLEITNREELINRCINKDYKVKNIQRDNKPNLLFIWDKSGNCFEIKEEAYND